MSPSQGGDSSNRHLTDNRLQQPVEERTGRSRKIQGGPGIFGNGSEISRDIQDTRDVQEHQRCPRGIPSYSVTLEKKSIAIAFNIQVQIIVFSCIFA